MRGRGLLSWHGRLQRWRSSCSRGLFARLVALGSGEKRRRSSGSVWARGLSWAALRMSMDAAAAGRSSQARHQSCASRKERPRGWRAFLSAACCLLLRPPAVLSAGQRHHAGCYLVSWRVQACVREALAPRRHQRSTRRTLASFVVRVQLLVPRQLLSGPLWGRPWSA